MSAVHSSRKAVVGGRGKESPSIRTSIHVCLRNNISPHIVVNGLQWQEIRGVLVMQVGKATPADYGHG